MTVGISETSSGFRAHSGKSELNFIGVMHFMTLGFVW